MTPERWARLESLFHDARALPAGERDGFLEHACAGDASLRTDLESLLAQPEGLLQEGAGAAAAALISTPVRGNREGWRIGPYTLGPLIGSGGMGDVYRARDAKLARDVAVKVLPGALAQDPGRLARFEREARVLASLNHAHIAAIYGIEEQEGVCGLVLELVEGVTLAETLASGALDVDAALEMARQIADGLAAAHQQGVVHRDLKPSNIKITPRGVVKILDFGLAKLDAAHSAQPSALPVLGTADGVVLGTVAYMSPEQARGAAVDKRTDIWAFGCVVYELLTGTRAFPGESSADVLGAIVTADPDWTRLPAPTPRPVRALLRRCLTKNAERRLHDIADARIELEDVLSGTDSHESHRATPSRRWRARLPWAVAAVACAGAAVALWFLVAAHRPPPSSLLQVSLPVPDGVSIYAIGRGSSVVVSPDGQLVVFAGIRDGRTQLYARRLGESASRPLPGTEGATSPFFSPDGRWIGFLDATPPRSPVAASLKKISVDGGAAVTIIDSVAQGMRDFAVQSATWAPDDTIVFSASASKARGLWRVSAAGGSPRRLTTVRADEGNHAWPHVIGDRNAVLFTVWNNSGFEGGRIAVQSLDGGEPATLVPGASYGRIVRSADGRAWLVSARPEGLQAAPFDIETLRLTGSAVPVLDGVLTNLSGGAHFSVSNDGTLAYVPGGLDELKKTAVWVDRNGRATEIDGLRDLGFQYRLAPGGRRLVSVNAVGPDRDLWIDDLTGRAPRTRLTFNRVLNAPLWTADGQRIIYARDAPSPNLFWRAADGGDDEQRLTTSANAQWPYSVSPDGSQLAYREIDPETRGDIWILPLRPLGRPRVLVRTPAADLSPMFSPDGRWIAYSSTVSGTPEIYLTASLDGRERTPVSKGGGVEPRWAPDGRELYYRTNAPETARGDLMVVSVDTTGSKPRIGAPRVLFPCPYQGFGDVTPDGRFLFLKRTPEASPSRVIPLVLNWFQELERKTRSR